MPRHRAAWRPPGMRIRRSRKATPRTMVREYGDRKAFERDAAKLSRGGWVVASAEEVAPQSGGVGRVAVVIATLGLAGRRKPKVIAVYRARR